MWERHKLSYIKSDTTTATRTLSAVGTTRSTVYTPQSNPTPSTSTCSLPFNRAFSFFPRSYREIDSILFPSSNCRHVRTCPTTAQATTATSAPAPQPTRDTPTDSPPPTCIRN
ncbi:hypothetical protein J6590_003399 [Homalodisca vitripennis]|nr:hypothetical protein J6590_003399 [Homalodisca vitripennis]